MVVEIGGWGKVVLQQGNGIGGYRWPWKGVWAREIDKEG